MSTCNTHSNTPEQVGEIECSEGNIAYSIYYDNYYDYQSGRIKIGAWLFDGEDTQQSELCQLGEPKLFFNLFTITITEFHLDDQYNIIFSANICCENELQCDPICTSYCNETTLIQRECVSGECITIGEIQDHTSCSSKYKCSDGNCIPNVNGEYQNLLDCEAGCTQILYDCINNECVQSDNGQYQNQESCVQACSRICTYELVIKLEARYQNDYTTNKEFAQDIHDIVTKEDTLIELQNIATSYIADIEIEVTVKYDNNDPNRSADIYICFYQTITQSSINGNDLIISVLPVIAPIYIVAAAVITLLIITIIVLIANIMCVEKYKDGKKIKDCGSPDTAGEETTSEMLCIDFADENLKDDILFIQYNDIAAGKITVETSQYAKCEGFKEAIKNYKPPLSDKVNTDNGEIDVATGSKCSTPAQCSTGCICSDGCKLIEINEISHAAVCIDEKTSLPTITKHVGLTDKEIDEMVNNSVLSELKSYAQDDITVLLALANEMKMKQSITEKDLDEVKSKYKILTQCINASTKNIEISACLKSEDRNDIITILNPIVPEIVDGRIDDIIAIVNKYKGIVKMYELSGYGTIENINEIKNAITKIEICIDTYDNSKRDSIAMKEVAMCTGAYKNIIIKYMSEVAIDEKTKSENTNSQLDLCNKWLGVPCDTLKTGALVIGGLIGFKFLSDIFGSKN